MATTLALLEDILSLLGYGGQYDDREHGRSQDQQAAGDRARQEPERVAAGDDHGAPQVLLQHGPEHEAEKEGRRLAIELHEHVAEQPEGGDREKVEDVVLDAEDADRAEGEDRRKQHVV